MSPGAAQDSARLHYDYGMTMGEQLVVYPHGKIVDFGLYKRAQTLAQDEYVEPDIQLAFGDTIVPVAYRSFSFESDRGNGVKTRTANLIQFDLIKNGKVSATGWSTYEPEYAPMKWTRFLGDYVALIIVLTVVGFAFAIIYWLWLWIYRKIQDWRGREDVTDEDIWFKYIYVFLSLALSLLCVYLVHNEEEALNIYYHPDMFAHWSEYATLTKFIPFVVMLWLVSIVAMGVEMLVKMRSIWFIMTYIGWLFIGFLIIGLTLIASWIIYIMLPSVLAFLVVMLFGKMDVATGGQLSKSSSSDTKMVFYDDHGTQYTSGSARDNANAKIRANKQD
jgi:hypothetical protein